MEQTTSTSTKSRQAEIEELLRLIGGLEESIRIALDEKDWDFVKLLKEMKPRYYNRLRRVIHGLPQEEPKVGTEEDS
jgi:hypothetical protein